MFSSPSGTVEVYNGSNFFFIRSGLCLSKQNVPWLSVYLSVYLSICLDNKTSMCQIEVDVMWDKVVSHAPEGEWFKVGALGEFMCVFMLALSENKVCYMFVHALDVRNHKVKVEYYIYIYIYINMYMHIYMHVYTHCIQACMSMQVYMHVHSQANFHGFSVSTTRIQV